MFPPHRFCQGVSSLGVSSMNLKQHMCDINFIWSYIAIQYMPSENLNRFRCSLIRLNQHKSFVQIQMNVHHL